MKQQLKGMSANQVNFQRYLYGEDIILRFAFYFVLIYARWGLISVFSRLFRATTTGDH
ncbi:hypothetical protein HUG15_08460 [Salicibibacter cibarius]|uniref:Uncharacterized protein n=1 Tax=Salicibibacter cibarius TaxID=2743000 RepID=A0A7T6Z2N0_9BACI|nr:hypothetical protein HUG15_08460 [Salicibibacter cibarius]